MSTSSSTLSPKETTTPSPTPQSNPANSSNLYLFTFVATLFVLLLISSTIIFRSYILRRRYQRNLQEALASGVVLTPREQGSRRKRFRTRPKFYDTWLDPAGDDTWEDIMPLSVLPVKPKRRRKQTTPVENGADNRGPGFSERFMNALTMGRNRVFRLSSVPSPQAHQEDFESPQVAETVASPVSVPTSPVTPDVEKGPTVSTSLPTVQFQVAVLVQMPTPRHNRFQERDIFTTDRTEEDELPEVVFGVTRLACKQPEAPTGASQ